MVIFKVISEFGLIEVCKLKEQSFIFQIAVEKVQTVGKVFEKVTMTWQSYLYTYESSEKWTFITASLWGCH